MNWADNIRKAQALLHQSEEELKEGHIEKSLELTRKASLLYKDVSLSFGNFVTEVTEAVETSDALIIESIKVLVKS